jgi:NAD(P)-dependent dehydrogenase (short-subunit alcohol dehydrogenase family)
MSHISSTEFEGKKVIVIGGSAGIGRQAAIDVMNSGGSAVVVGRDEQRVRDTVATLQSSGDAKGVTAELSDRSAVANLRHCAHGRCRRQRNGLIEKNSRAYRLGSHLSWRPLMTGHK